MSNVVSSIAYRLRFTGKHKPKRPHSSDLMKKQKKPVKRRRCRDKSRCCQVVNVNNAKWNHYKTKLNKKQKSTKGSAAVNSTKVSDEKLTLGKLNTYTINWTDSRDTMLEIMKYPKANNIEWTQESMMTFLASCFKPVDINVTFAALIGKVGGSAQTAFYLLPSQRTKLVESFLELVFNEKSMFIYCYYSFQINLFLPPWVGDLPPPVSGISPTDFFTVQELRWSM